MAEGGSGFQIEWLLSLPLSEFLEWCRVCDERMMKRLNALKQK